MLGQLIAPDKSPPNAFHHDLRKRLFGRHMKHARALEFLTASAVLLAVLYGTTFEDFKRFSEAYKTIVEHGATLYGDRGVYIALSEDFISKTPADWHVYRIV